MAEVWGRGRGSSRASTHSTLCELFPHPCRPLPTPCPPLASCPSTPTPAAPHPQPTTSPSWLPLTLLLLGSWRASSGPHRTAASSPQPRTPCRGPATFTDCFGVGVSHRRPGARGVTGMPEDPGGLGTWDLLREPTKTGCRHCRWGRVTVCSLSLEVPVSFPPVCAGHCVYAGVWRSSSDVLLLVGGDPH